jgi:hypothetical protein
MIIRVHSAVRVLQTVVYLQRSGFHFIETNVNVVSSPQRTSKRSGKRRGRIQTTVRPETCINRSPNHDTSHLTLDGFVDIVYAKCVQNGLYYRSEHVLGYLKYPVLLNS